MGKNHSDFETLCLYLCFLLLILLLLFFSFHTINLTVYWRNNTNIPTVMENTILKFFTVLLVYQDRSTKFQCDWLKKAVYFLTVLEVGNQRPRCQESWFPVRPLSLTCRWLCSCCPFAWLLCCAYTSLVTLPLFP